MARISKEEIVVFVEDNIQDFHDRRLRSLERLKLADVLSRKNPYLFKAKNVNTPGDFIKSILDAHLSSQEEGLFGEFLERLALFVCSRVYGGEKSSAEGIDLEFKKDDTYYLVTIKSGPNWGNSQAIKRMVDAFKKAKRIRKTNLAGGKVVGVNGCCYGKDDKPDKGDYLKLCGQRFWEFISGDPNLYTELIEPLGHKAKERNEDFQAQFAQVVESFIEQFKKEYCDPQGAILWDKIVRFNSGKRE